MRIFISSKILWGIVTSVATIIGLASLSYFYFLHLSESTGWANHARRVLQDVADIRSLLTRAESAQRGYLLFGDDAMAKASVIDAADEANLVDELDSLTRENQEQRRLVGELRQRLKDHRRFSQLVVTSRSNSIEDALDVMKSASYGNTLTSTQRTLDLIREEQQGAMLSHSLAFRSGFYRFVTSWLVLLVVTIGVLVALALVINQTLRSRMLAEERLRDAELETKKINQDLESFSYSVSHDLRSPLRSINGYTSALLEDYSDKLDEEGRRLLNVIVANAKKMNQLIDDLLAFSRLGRQELRKEEVNVEEQVHGIWTELYEREGNRKVVVTIGPLGYARIDANMMRQVWLNLLGNALKYSRKKASAAIEVGRIEDAQEVTFFVKDNGAGFDMLYVDKLFGVFQRLHKPSEFEGTGVGLALVKRIMERHHGRVWAIGKVDEGATFYIALPKR